MDSSATTKIDQLLDKARAGDDVAVSELLTMHRERLKRMVQLRMHPRLQSRIDSSDVIQEACLHASRLLPDYLKDPGLPFYPWLRHLTMLKLSELHRHHLRVQKRDADRELSIFHVGVPGASTALLAAQLLGKLTSPSEAAMREERRARIERVLNAMDARDREILALRHFEQLSTREAALVLGLSKAGAGSRYLRAIGRFRRMLDEDSNSVEL